MSEFDYDLFVIGAGSGGVRAARIAASHGAKVAIAEEHRYGGTCVIRGCVPKKLLVYASHFSEEFENAEGFGWSVGERSFSWQSLIEAKDKEISRLEGLYRSNLERHNVETFDTRAVVEDAHTVRLLSTRQTITAKTILIAVGASPNVDTAIPGHEFAITSNEAFHLKELPGSVLVLGGGYIAVEFAGIFNGLGSQTHLMYRGDTILRGFDNELRVAVQEEISKKGVDVITRDVVTRIVKRDDGKLEVTSQQGRTMVVDQVMYAIGRDAHTKDLGLEKAGVEMRANGEIVVDAEVAVLGALDLRGGGCDRTRGVDAGCHPGRSCLCRQRFRRQALDRGSQPDCDRGLLAAGTRHGRSVRGRGDRGLSEP